MKKKTFAFLLAATAFNNNAWKLDDKGNVVLKDGNPVYVDSNGREMVVQSDTISRLNGEAKTHREGKEAAEAKLKAFEGIDPEKARTAIDTVSKLDQKKLIDAGEVDKVRNEVSSQFNAKITELEKTVATLNASNEAKDINAVFANSEFIRNNIAVPRDMFEASFRGNFKVENGQVVAYDKAGNRLMSKSKAGEYADAEEALQLLVEAHPQKDTIIKANTGNGSGSQGGGGAKGGGRYMKRSDFEKLPPGQQSAESAKMRAGELTLTD